MTDLVEENKQLRAQLKAACNQLMAMPLKQAKPLTDHEIEMLAHEFNLLDDYPHEFVRAIEKRYGIK